LLGFADTKSQVTVVTRGHAIGNNRAIVFMTMNNCRDVLHITSASDSKLAGGKKE
jgi:hypothetical protein